MTPQPGTPLPALRTPQGIPKNSHTSPGWWLNNLTQKERPKNSISWCKRPQNDPSGMRMPGRGFCISQLQPRVDEEVSPFDPTLPSEDFSILSQIRSCPSLITVEIQISQV